jgi:hypothetical protein
MLLSTINTVIARRRLVVWLAEMASEDLLGLARHWRSEAIHRACNLVQVTTQLGREPQRNKDDSGSQTTTSLGSSYISWNPSSLGGAVERTVPPNTRSLISLIEHLTPRSLPKFLRALLFSRLTLTIVS